MLPQPLGPPPGPPASPAPQQQQQQQPMQQQAPKQQKPAVYAHEEEDDDLVIQLDAPQPAAQFRPNDDDVGSACLLSCQSADCLSAACMRQNEHCTMLPACHIIGLPAYRNNGIA